MQFYSRKYELYLFEIELEKKLDEIGFLFHSMQFSRYSTDSHITRAHCSFMSAADANRYKTGLYELVSTARLRIVQGALLADFANIIRPAARRNSTVFRKAVQPLFQKIFKFFRGARFIILIKDETNTARTGFETELGRCGTSDDFSRLVAQGRREILTNSELFVNPLFKKFSNSFLQRSFHQDLNPRIWKRAQHYHLKANWKGAEREMISRCPTSGAKRNSTELWRARQGVLKIFLNFLRIVGIINEKSALQVLAPRFQFDFYA